LEFKAIGGNYILAYLRSFIILKEELPNNFLIAAI